MLPREELVRLFGSAEALAEIDRQSAEEVAKWPPLSPGQKARLRALFHPDYSKEAPVTEAADPPRWESHADRMIAKSRAEGDEAKVRYWERVKAEVDKAPPLSASTRDKLAVLLRPTPEEATQAAIERYAEELAAQAPPLSDEMKAELRILLNPPRQRPAAVRPKTPASLPSADPDAAAAVRPAWTAPAVSRVAEPPRRNAVYVIGTGNDGRVKIGTTVNLKQRVGDISRMSPVEIRLLWSTEGGYELERALHAEFAQHRLHGEWFDFGDEDPVALVSSAVDRLRDHPVQS